MLEILRSLFVIVIKVLSLRPEKSADPVTSEEAFHSIRYCIALVKKGLVRVKWLLLFRSNKI